MTNLAVALPVSSTSRKRTSSETPETLQSEWWVLFQAWLFAGGYATLYARGLVAQLRAEIPDATAMAPLEALSQQGLARAAAASDGSLKPTWRRTIHWKKLREFVLFQRGIGAQAATPGKLPQHMAELPIWLRELLERYVRTRQRQWPPHARVAQTRNLVYQLCLVCNFFLTHYHWADWGQLSMRWVDAFVDARLQSGRSASTVNGALYALQGLCRYLREEGTAIPLPLTEIKPLDLPRRLPRPLADEEIRRLEHCIQAAMREATTRLGLQRAIMDLAWFYLMWHCGLRLGEAQRLTVKDLDLSARKLLVRNSKERKDRVVYLSDTTVQALRQHLNTRADTQAQHLFTYHHRLIDTSTLEDRLAHYGRRARVDVTPHRLRHTFASQMLNAGMPIASLQRYLGHEQLDTTLVYAAVSDPLLQQDYYRGAAAFDPASARLAPAWTPEQRAELQRLLKSLQASGQSPEEVAATHARIQQLLGESPAGES